MPSHYNDFDPNEPVEEAPRAQDEEHMEDDSEVHEDEEPMEDEDSVEEDNGPEPPSLFGDSEPEPKKRAPRPKETTSELRSETSGDTRSVGRQVRKLLEGLGSIQGKQKRRRGGRRPTAPGVPALPEKDDVVVEIKVKSRSEPTIARPPVIPVTRRRGIGGF